MTIFTKCDNCGRWVIEREMDYFTGIGNVCIDCERELLLENNGGMK